MITKQEIMDFAREFSLEAKTVEKDYVLGWLLAGIANHTALFDKWIFKGGTCLKKCYFETYRFSEDLDYTLIDEAHVDSAFLVACFKEIAKWIYDITGIQIPEDQIRFEVYENKAGKVSIEGRIYYVGPLDRRASPARIKLDLTSDEILVLPSVMRDVHHPYSDKPQDGIKAHCYNFSEVFAEKIRALSERARPRDLYDVVHLYRHATPGEKPASILEVLKKKCEYKAIPVPTMQLLNNHPKIHELEKEWSNMLAHQLPMLPAKEEFWQELPNVFDWLHGDSSKVLKEQAPLPAGQKIDTSWQPPSMIQAWHMGVPVELIRYAGANHLCLEIEYNNEKRLIEPYNLRRTQEGNLILVAIQRNINDWRTFRIDRIQGMKISAVSFTPQYFISLTPFTQINSEVLERSYNNSTPRMRSRRLTPVHTYTVQCPLCDKKFKRSKFDRKLHAHKNQNGMPCRARWGVII